MNKSKIYIDEKLNLVLPKAATFADISNFFETDYEEWEKKNPQLVFNNEGGEENQGYLMGFWLFEIYDSNSRELAQEIRELIEKRSNKNVCKFFTEKDIYNPKNPKADEDLQIFFHTKFV